jgi:hypothetical protein
MESFVQEGDLVISELLCTELQKLMFIHCDFVSISRCISVFTCNRCHTPQTLERTL